MITAPDSPGVAELVEWFGSWPSFHDAEVTRIHLNRFGPSYVDVHVFRMTTDLTATGHYRCDMHAVVTFRTHSSTRDRADRLQSSKRNLRTEPCL